MTEWTCAHCGKDLTNHEYEMNSLILASRVAPSDSSVILDTYFVPELEQDYHFCNLRCLEGWLKDD